MITNTNITIDDLFDYLGVKGSFQDREKAFLTAEGYTDWDAFLIAKGFTQGGLVSKVQELMTMTPSRSEIKNDVRIVFEDDNWKILIPLSFEASKLYGTGTKWCTTNKTYYDNYMRDGLLYYLVDKRINRKFGLPIPSNRGLKVAVSSFTLYNNEDCGLNINQIKLIYGSDFDAVAEKVRLDFVEQLKIKLRIQTLENSKRAIAKLKSDMSSVDIKDEELEKLFSSLIDRISSI